MLENAWREMLTLYRCGTADFAKSRLLADGGTYDSLLAETNGKSLEQLTQMALEAGVEAGGVGKSADALITQMLELRLDPLCEPDEVTASLLPCGAALASCM